jgi:hypothetical protein
MVMKGKNFKQQVMPKEDFDEGTIVVYEGSHEVSQYILAKGPYFLFQTNTNGGNHLGSPDNNYF